MRFFNLATIKQSRGLLLGAVALVSVLAVGATFSTILVFKSAGGSLTAYLVAPVDGRNHDCWGRACTDGISWNTSNSIEAVVRLVNPTNVTLKAYVAAYTFYTGSPRFLGCAQRVLGKNSYAEVNMVDDVNFFLSDSHDYTVKVLSVNALTNAVQAGVKGWLTHLFAVTIDAGNEIRILQAREYPLQGVPIEVLRAGEADNIQSDCAA